MPMVDFGVINVCPKRFGPLAARCPRVLCAGVEKDDRSACSEPRLFALAATLRQQLLLAVPRPSQASPPTP
jgi:hypothetical protein